MCNRCNSDSLVILRSPTDHHKTTGSHIPPKNFVCRIPNAVSQTSVNPKGMKQHKEKLILDDWANGNTFWTRNCEKALNAYHFSKYKDENIGNTSYCWKQFHN